MKKIETWEDLKEALKNNPYGSYFGYITMYGECLIIKDNALAFTQDGDLIRYCCDEEEWWERCYLKRRTYQQMYDIIKLMLE